MHRVQSIILKELFRTLKLLIVRLECYGYSIDLEDPRSAEELPLGQDFEYTSPVESMIYNKEAYSPPPTALDNPKKRKRHISGSKKKGKEKKIQETIPKSSSEEDASVENKD